MKRMNWDDIRLLNRVVRAGTFRLAAQSTGLSPATLSRRIDDLEVALGEKLLERFKTGCSPTIAGQRIVAWAEQMEEIALEIERTRDQKGAHIAEGTVRINTDEWMSYFLTTRFVPFRQMYPHVDVEIVTSHRPYNLARREADIAIRPFMPDQAELIVRKVGTLRYGLYCNKAYLAAKREDIDQRHWAALDFVGFDEPRGEFASDRWLRALPGARTPWMRCSYGLGIFDGVIHGAGLGVLANFIAKDNSSLHAVEPHITELDQEIWLSMHKGLKSSTRIRAITDFIVELVSRDMARHEAAQ